MSLVLNASLPSSPAQSAVLTALLHFLSAVRAIPTVQRISYSVPDEYLHLWILLREASPETEDQISDLDREFRVAAGGPPVDVHVFALTKVQEPNLPHGGVIFER